MSTPTLATKAGAKVETAQNPTNTAFFQFMTISSIVEMRTVRWGHGNLSFRL